jgi:hypothetical protein
MATQTPKYAAFRAQLHEDLIPFLNALERSYAQRKSARERAKTPTRSLEGARQDWLQFGHFDDCGPSYTDDYKQATNKIEYWIPAKIAAEKYHKLCIYKFLEAGGTPDQIREITEHLVKMNHNLNVNLTDNPELTMAQVEGTIARISVTETDNMSFATCKVVILLVGHTTLIKGEVTGKADQLDPIKLTAPGDTVSFEHTSDFHEYIHGFQNHTLAEMMK